MRLQAVLFDMDGVLFDTQRVYAEAWIEAARQLGYPLDMETYTTYILGHDGDYAEAEMRRLFGDAFPVEEFRRRRRAYASEVLANGGLRLKPGVHDLLSLLDAHAIPRAVATSNARWVAEQFLTQTDLRDAFQVVVGREDVQHAKPHPEIFLKAAAALGAEPPHVVVLEDSGAGLQAAARADMVPIFVPDLMRPPDDVRQLAAFEFASLHDVAAWLSTCLTAEKC